MNGQGDRQDLATCPFCAAAAEAGTHRPGALRHYYVQCSNSECLVQPCCIADTMAEAEAGWQTRNDSNGGTPLAEPTGSAFEHGMVTWECNECQQIGATYCCRISVDIGHGDNHALVCPQRCPWFDWCESDWYRVSKPNTQVSGGNASAESDSSQAGKDSAE